MTKKNWEKQHTIVLFLLIILGTIYFEFVGQTGAIEFDDSAAYLAPNIWQGIMPIYHLFIKINRILFGDSYLQITAILQGLIAVICTCIFTVYITMIFQLKWFEMPVIYLCTLIPFSVELPEYINTHVIYTEGIAYSLYYIFVIVCFSYIVSTRKTAILYLVSISFATFMALIRPQLLLLLLIVGIISAYKIYLTKINLLFRFPLMVGAIVITTMIGVFTTYGIRHLYIHSADRIFSTNSSDEEYSYDVINLIDEPVPCSFDVTNDNDDESNYTSEEYLSQQSNDQIARMLFMRGMYLADAEDSHLYSRREISIYFDVVRKCLDDHKLTYIYNPGGLYGWKHVADTKIYDACFELLPRNAMDYEDRIYIWEHMNEVLICLGITEILHHPIRFIYYSFTLFIPGFISTVFFNIQKIYLACHIYTAFIYFSAIYIGFHHYKNDISSIKSYAGKFILFSVMSNIVFVCVTNLIFFGMQRYFLYVFGVFYCSVYIGLRTYIAQKYECRINK